MNQLSLMKTNANGIALHLAHPALCWFSGCRWKMQRSKKAEHGKILCRNQNVALTSWVPDPLTKILKLFFHWVEFTDWLLYRNLGESPKHLDRDSWVCFSIFQNCYKSKILIFSLQKRNPIWWCICCAWYNLSTMHIHIRMSHCTP